MSVVATAGDQVKGCGGLDIRLHASASYQESGAGPVRPCAEGASGGHPRQAAVELGAFHHGRTRQGEAQRGTARTLARRPYPRPHRLQRPRRCQKQHSPGGPRKIPAESDAPTDGRGQRDQKERIATAEEVQDAQGVGTT